MKINSLPHFLDFWDWCNQKSIASEDDLYEIIDLAYNVDTRLEYVTDDVVRLLANSSHASQQKDFETSAKKIGTSKTRIVKLISDLAKETVQESVATASGKLIKKNTKIYAEEYYEYLAKNWQAITKFYGDFP